MSIIVPAFPSVPAGDLSMRAKWQRDAALPLSLRLRKVTQYVSGLLLAKLRLRHATQLGHHVRAQGRPSITNDGTLIIGDRTLVRSTRIPVELAVSHGATLTIGESVRINYGASIAATSLIVIGDRVRIGPYVMIVDTDFHGLEDRMERPAGRPVIIGDDAWIGAKASVLKGVRIGRGAVVGVGAVVTRDVPDGAIVAGVPARIVKSLQASTGGSESAA